MMTATIRKGMLAAAAVIFAASSIGFAKSPLQKRINFNINVPYSLRMGDYVLPPGDYVLNQVSESDLTVFALYRGTNLMHSPVAMIQTVRVDYLPGEFPQKTRIALSIDEGSEDAHPVLRGWTIPGDDGWEIVGVVPRKGSYIAKVQ
jgi:hypothetical protein